MNAYVRLNMECFTPLVFSSSGGISHEATVFYERLAELLCHKWEENY